MNSGEEESARDRFAADLAAATKLSLQTHEEEELRRRQRVSAPAATAFAVTNVADPWAGKFPWRFFFFFFFYYSSTQVFSTVFLSFHSLPISPSPFQTQTAFSR